LAQAKPKDFLNRLEEIRTILFHKTVPATGFSESEFVRDVDGMIKSLNMSVNTHEQELQVVLTDDPIDLLLCGTDVHGSCQRVDASPTHNKGLLGYLIDGKNRLVAIKSPQGNIVARCLLRLLWDGEQPVLFRERIYPSNISAKQLSGINEFVKQIANELKLPLTSLDKGEKYPRTLAALGGPAPYEYCDAAWGVRDSRGFTISDANYLK
jgi:hypothetical protein